MPSLLRVSIVILLAIGGSTSSWAAVPAEDFWRAAGERAAIVAGGAEAADAGLDVLTKGGTAADAAVAAMLVLNVTDPANFCFGGEMSVLVYDAKAKRVQVVCGQGVAPQMATVEWFEQHKGGKVPGDRDPTTAAVPGSLDALLTLLDRYGTRTFAASAQPMLAVLDKNAKEWRPNLARNVRRLIEAEQGAAGDRKAGLRRVADFFYRGPLAQDLDAWSRTNGGLLRAADLAAHVTRIEEPLSVDYRGYTVYKCGAWTQGPCLLETLRLLEKYDLKAMGRNRPDYVHMLVEAMKLALADRDTYYADPRFVDVPLPSLLSPEYANVRRPLIDLARASVELRPGDPRGNKALLGTLPQDYRTGKRGQAPRGDLLSQVSASTARSQPPFSIGDTTTCVVADREGNVVAATPSGWAGVLAGETGIILGSRLRSLNTWRGHPNCVAPGKRPRNTLTPTIVMKDDKPVAAISVAGGDQQDQVSLQLLLGWLEFRLSPAEAVTAPRFMTEHHVGSFNQPPPKLGNLTIEQAFGETTLEALRARGHQVTIAKPPVGHPVMLTIDPGTGRRQAAGDPKAKRHARAE